MAAQDTLARLAAEGNGVAVEPARLAGHAALVADMNALVRQRRADPSRARRQPLEPADLPARAGRRGQGAGRSGVTAILDLGLCDLADAIADGSLTSEAATEAALAGLETVGRELNAVVRLHADRARQQARDVDRSG